MADRTKLNTRESRECVIVGRPVVIKLENPCARQATMRRRFWGVNVSGTGCAVDQSEFRDAHARLCEESLRCVALQVELRCDAIRKSRSVMQRTATEVRVG